MELFLMSFMQDLQLPEWQLVVMVVGVTDDDYDDNHFRIQVDVLPAAMQEKEYKKATDVSEILYLYVP